MENNRNKKYQKNQVQENILIDINNYLKSKELELIEQFSIPRYPVIFIVGAQRSGTTLLMQLISQLYNVSYPNNFIARFWEAPYMGAMLYENITKQIEQHKTNFTSDLGYTKGLNGAHEFGYFWKKWFPWESWEEKKYNKIDYAVLQKQLAAWESVNNKPLIFKNLIQLDYNIEKLYNLFPNAIFVYLKRNLIFNIQSTYQSRIKLFNDETKWFGVKPKSYLRLVKLPIIEQITKQIININNDIEVQLSKVPTKNVIKINYEDLINDYLSEINKIASSTKLKKIRINNKIDLISANKKNVNDDIFNQITDSVKAFSI